MEDQLKSSGGTDYKTLKLETLERFKTNRKLEDITEDYD